MSHECPGVNPCPPRWVASLRASSSSRYPVGWADVRRPNTCRAKYSLSVRHRRAARVGPRASGPTSPLSLAASTAVAAFWDQFWHWHPKRMISSPYNWGFCCEDRPTAMRPNRWGGQSRRFTDAGTDSSRDMPAYFTDRAPALRRDLAPDRAKRIGEGTFLRASDPSISGDGRHRALDS